MKKNQTLLRPNTHGFENVEIKKDVRKVMGRVLRDPAGGVNESL